LSRNYLPGQPKGGIIGAIILGIIGAVVRGFLAGLTFKRDMTTGFNIKTIAAVGRSTYSWCSI